MALSNLIEVVINTMVSWAIYQIRIGWEINTIMSTEIYTGFCLNLNTPTGMFKKRSLMGFSFPPNVVHILGLLGFAKIEIIHDLTRNITYVNLADLAV